MHDSSQSATQPDPTNQSSMGTNQTAQLVEQLLQAQVDWTLADITAASHSAQADELAKIKLLAQLVSDTADSDRPNRPQTAEMGTDSDSDSQSSSGYKIDGANTKATSPDGQSQPRQIALPLVGSPTHSIRTTTMLCLMTSNIATLCPACIPHVLGGSVSSRKKRTGQSTILPPDHSSSPVWR